MTTEGPAYQPPRVSGIFKDRREGNDRRYHDSVLRDQGRRDQDRRNTNDQFSPRPWWLRVGYVVAEISNSSTPD